MTKNFYSEKPVIKFFTAAIEMGEIINAIKLLNYPAEVKRTAYIIIRNETANGKSVINGTNVAGVQSDSGRWDAKFDKSIIATCLKDENRTGNERGFVVFDTLANGIAFLCEKVQVRGLFVGGTTHKITSIVVKNETDLAVAYNREWVTGQANYIPTKDEVSNFVSMYKQAARIFV